jgi:hypothetical protein
MVAIAANTHIANGENPHGVTIEQIGAAPAGYGLGKLTSYEVYSDSEIDTVLIDIINSMGDQTFKRIVLSFKSTTNFTNAGGHYYTDIYKLSQNYASITIKSYIGGGREMQRNWYAGTLEPWEWVNPPMSLGVEYRTTKRYNGNAVYMKAINCGAAPASSGKSVAHGIANCRPISCIGRITSSTNLIPYVSTSGARINISANSVNINVYASYAPAETSDVIALLEYYKA